MLKLLYFLVRFLYRLFGGIFNIPLSEAGARATGLVNGGAAIAGLPPMIGAADAATEPATAEACERAWTDAVCAAKAWWADMVGWAEAGAVTAC